MTTNIDIAQNETVCQAWWIEPCIASLSFAVWIHIFWYEERRRGLSRHNRLVDTFGISSMGDLYKSFIAYWLGILVLKTVSPKTRELPDDIIPSDVSGFAYVFCEVAAGIVLYDAIFFFVHLLMHEVPWLRHLHQRHHSAPQNTLEARDVVRHSLIDGSLQVICNILVQQYTPWGCVKSRAARALHNVVVTGMLTESHTASPTPNLWRRWFVGVREHRNHHMGVRKGVKCGKAHIRYQQFFGYLDAILHRSRENVKR